MSGLGMTLNIAKGALAAQQYGLNVTGHNIANVNTSSYSRQSVLYGPAMPILSSGFLLGTGVDVEQIQRSSDQLLENRLMQQQCSMCSYEETAAYMSIMESVFNENSEAGLSTLISEFWNSWQDLSNNPTGSSERIAVYDKGTAVAEQFDFLKAETMQLEVELTCEIESSISEINSLTKQIAAINNDIVGLEAGGNANDQRDQRNALVAKLSELIDIQSFEQPDGALTVTAAKGFVLVNRVDNYGLELMGGQVYWEGSYGNSTDITDRIKGGKIGGWLEMRDEIIPKYMTQLDALSRGFAWSVNFQHSQGVGLDYFSSSVEGTYAADSSGDFSTLAYGDRIDYTKDFKMWIQDSGVLPAEFSSIEIDLGISDAVQVSGNSGNALKKYSFTVTKGGDVTDSENLPKITCKSLNADGSEQVEGTIQIQEGINEYTFGNGLVLTLSEESVQFVAGNTFTMNTDSTGEIDALELDISGQANSILDNYKFRVNSDGEIGTDTIEISWSNSSKNGSFILNAETTSVELDGMTLLFTDGTLFENDGFTIATDEEGNPTVNLSSEWHWTLDSFASQFNSQAAGLGIKAEKNSNNTLSFRPESGDYSFAFSYDATQDSGLAAALGINTFFVGTDAMTIEVNSVLEETKYIAAGRIDSNNGDYSSGNNANAFALADLQYKTVSIAQWDFSRGTDSHSSVLITTIEDYYQSMIGSMGIKSISISRAMDFSEIMANEISIQRDSISAVSIDEEMVNMIKYQQAFSAASKLLSTADEMLETLISSI